MLIKIDPYQWLSFSACFAVSFQQWSSAWILVNSFCALSGAVCSLFCSVWDCACMHLPFSFLFFFWSTSRVHNCSAGLRLPNLNCFTNNLIQQLEGKSSLCMLFVRVWPRWTVCLVSACDCSAVICCCYLLLFGSGVMHGLESWCLFTVQLVA